MSYRNRYLKSHRSGLHLCGYCFKSMFTSDMTVDHIIPQNTVRKFKTLSTVLLPLSYIVLIVLVYLGKDVNRLYFLAPLVLPVIYYILNFYVDTTFNLVSCCSSCNSKKTDKLGLYTLRGYFAKVLFTMFNWRVIISSSLLIIVTSLVVIG